MTEEIIVDLNESVFSLLTGNEGKKLLLLDNLWYEVRAINSASISHISFNVNELTHAQGTSYLSLIQSEKVARFEEIRHKELMSKDPETITETKHDPSFI